jgi:hypothetical protein
VTKTAQGGSSNPIQVNNNDMPFTESNIILFVYNTGVTALELLLVFLTGYALNGARVLAVLSGNGTNADHGTVGKLQDAKRNRHIAIVVMLTFSLYCFQPLSTILLEPYTKCVYTDGIQVNLSTDYKMSNSLSELKGLEALINTTGNHVSLLVKTSNLLSSGEGVEVSKSSVQYKIIKTGFATSPGKSLWGTVIEGRNSYTVAKEFGYKCVPGTVTRTYNPNMCFNGTCNSNGAFCDISGPLQFSSTDDYFTVHNVWILGILPLADNGTNYDDQALATCNKRNSTLTVFGVIFIQKK